MTKGAYEIIYLWEEEKICEYYNMIRKWKYIHLCLSFIFPITNDGINIGIFSSDVAGIIDTRPEDIQPNPCILNLNYTLLRFMTFDQELQNLREHSKEGNCMHLTYSG